VLKNSRIIHYFVGAGVGARKKAFCVWRMYSVCVCVSFVVSIFFGDQIVTELVVRVAR